MVEWGGGAAGFVGFEDLLKEWMGKLGTGVASLRLKLLVSAKLKFQLLLNFLRQDFGWFKFNFFQL